MRLIRAAYLEQTGSVKVVVRLKPLPPGSLRPPTLVILIRFDG